MKTITLFLDVLPDSLILDAIHIPGTTVMSSSCICNDL